MRNHKESTTSTEENLQNALGVNDLIDLFVDLNYEDIHNEILLIQFKIVAQKIGYSTEVIDRVIKLGHSEYSKLMEEIEAGLSKQKEILDPA